MYGDTTGQFNELAALYEFYKINKVMVTLIPSDLYGTGQVSAILSAVDPGQTRIETPNSINFFSRARTAQLHTAKGARRGLSFGGWLSNNVAQPYLLTYNTDTA